MAEKNDAVPIEAVPPGFAPPLPPPQDSPRTDEEPEAPLTPAPPLPEITPAGDTDGNSPAASVALSHEIWCGPQTDCMDPGMVDHDKVRANYLHQTQCLKELHMSRSVAPPQDENELLE